MYRTSAEYKQYISKPKPPFIMAKKRATVKKATAKKTTAKKPTTRSANTRKTTTKARLKRQDMIGISKLAKLSVSTLVKWHEGSLAVKPETELKIFDAANQFYEQEALLITERLEKLTEIEQRISETKAAMKEALKVLKTKTKGKASKVKKRAE